MNLLSLYEKLKTCLAETSTPEFWRETELKDYINEANAEFVKQSQILSKHIFLDIAEQDNNSWFLPDDVISIKGVQFRGRPVTMSRIQYLETAYAGTAHANTSIGEGKHFTRDWRLIVGEPIHWFKEDNFIKMFPRPFYGNEYDSPRMTVSSILLRGNSVANLSVAIPFLNKSSVDVYVNGVYQDYNTWDIVKNASDPALSAIQFNWSAELDVDYSVYVSYQTSPVLAAKYVSAIIEGQTEIIFPNASFISGLDSARVVLNGVTLLDSEFTVAEVSPGNVKVSLIILEPVLGGTVELTVYRRQSIDTSFSRLQDGNVSIDYYHLPKLLVNGEDEPEYPSAYHSAIWKYAAWLALSKEGEKTQDFQKARFYLEMFEREVTRAQSDSSEPIDLDYRLSAPFIL